MTTMARLKIAKVWKLRHDPRWRRLIRAYIGDEKGNKGRNRVALKDMPGMVANYFYANDDYVIGPTISHYMEMMWMDTNLYRLVDLGMKLEINA